MKIYYKGKKRDVFVTSDIHFFYKPVIERRKKDVSDEIKNHFKSIYYGDFIKDNWNETVSKDDIVLFLGDLSYKRNNNNEQYDSNLEIKDYINSFKILKECNGYKVWLLGNHDREMVRRIKENKFNASKELIKEYKTLLNEVFQNVEYNNLQVNNLIFTHEPEINIQEGFLNIHGHLHAGLTASMLRFSSRHFNANVEFNDYKPILIESIKNSV